MMMHNKFLSGNKNSSYCSPFNMLGEENFPPLINKDHAGGRKLSENGSSFLATPQNNNGNHRDSVVDTSHISERTTHNYTSPINNNDNDEGTITMSLFQRLMWPDEGGCFILSNDNRSTYNSTTGGTSGGLQPRSTTVSTATTGAESGERSSERFSDVVSPKKQNKDQPVTLKIEFADNNQMKNNNKPVTLNLAGSVFSNEEYVQAGQQLAASNNYQKSKQIESWAKSNEKFSGWGVQNEKFSIRKPDQQQQQQQSTIPTLKSVYETGEDPMNSRSSPSTNHASADNAMFRLDGAVDHNVIDHAAGEFCNMDHRYRGVLKRASYEHRYGFLRVPELLEYFKRDVYVRLDLLPSVEIGEVYEFNVVAHSFGRPGHLRAINVSFAGPNSLGPGQQAANARPVANTTYGEKAWDSGSTTTAPWDSSNHGGETSPTNMIAATTVDLRVYPTGKMTSQWDNKKSGALKDPADFFDDDEPVHAV